MVSINTNLSSFLVKQQLANSTNSLNKAIERMTTGYKVNHASDNAANYSIIRNMDKDISAYDVAADNVAMGSDFAATANDALDLVNTHLQRIRDLLSQASNGTYGEQSRKAIQAEVDSRLAEINRIFKSTEYNGIQLFNNGILPSTLNINISELNLTAGSFDVDVDGANYTVNLTNDDSLYSIISKLNAIGVDADFNEDSGVFTVDVDPNKITDYGTGFVSVLGLGYTDGYRAENLKTNEIYTVLESANANTRLSDVGVTDGSFTIIDTEGNETEDVISIDATISELFNKLWTHQMTGSINSNGVVTFSSTTGNRISGALAEQIGIDVDIVDTVYQGLTINTTNTLTHNYISNANSNTTLDKLGVQAGETLVVKDNEGIDLYTYTADNTSIQNTTLGELFNNLVESGYLSSANVNNGVVSLSSDVNNYVTGTIAQRFGISVVETDNALTTGVAQTSSEAVTYNEIHKADGDSTLAQLGIEAGETFIINSNSGEELYRFTADNISIQNTTIGDFLSGLVSNGYLSTANIANGVISLSSDVNNYATGTIADRLHIGVNTDSYSETIVTDITSSEPVTFSESAILSADTKLSDLGLQASDSLDVYNQSGVIITRFVAYDSFLNTRTLGDMFDELSDYINLSVSDGVVSVSSDNHYYVSGAIADSLGITPVQQYINLTTAISQTSTEPVTYVKSGTIQNGILLGSTGVESGDVLHLRDNSGNIIYTYTATDDSIQNDTLDGILDYMQRMGFLSDYSIDNGVVSVSSDVNNYLTGSIADKYSIGVETTNRIETQAITLTSASPVSYNEQNLSYYSTLGEIGLDSASFTMNDDTVITLDSTDSIREKFVSAGLNVDISDGYITISGGVDNYIKSMSSNLADALHIQVGEGYSYEVSDNAYHSNTDSRQIVCDGVYKMTEYSSLQDIAGISSATITLDDNTVISLGASDSIYEKLGQKLEVSLSDGTLTVAGKNGRSVKSMTPELANALHIQVGEGSTYSVSTPLYYVNPDSESTTLMHTRTMTETTTLADFGLESASFTMNDNTVVNISSSDSVYSKLQAAGLSVALEDGVLSIEGQEGVYIKSMSSNLKDVLKAGIGEGDSYIINNYTFNTNTTSEVQQFADTYTISTTTTLGDFGLDNASFTMNDNTVVNLTSADSVYSKLQSAGLDVRIGLDGKLVITGDENSYIKNMTQNLANVLHIQTGEGQTYETSHSVTHSNSNSKTQTYMSTATLTSANSSTYRMSDWGMSTNSKIYTNNVAISINRTDTIESLISKLNEAGIEASVNDENGTLKIVNSNNNYIISIDSSLKNTLGIEVGEGHTYTSHTETHHSATTSRILQENIKHTIAHDATENTLLKDFNKDNLNIEGDLVFDMADGQKVVRITAKDTIASLIDKLKEVGITAIFKNQALSISGNKNSVLLLDNSSSTTSYLAELLGMQHVDQLEDITCSDDLNALADSIYESKFNTPQFLCIQAGISGKEHDMISMDMRLALGRVTFKTSDSASASKGLDKIDEIIAKVAAKQTEYGAFSNRMESAAESITIALQNLVSSKSTLQDADIAVESSNYIKAQILQQAAATLLATANQMPAIALELL